MRVAVTGATGFLGLYVVRELAAQSHAVRCWHLSESDRSDFDPQTPLEWLPGELGDEGDSAALVRGCDAVVQAALYHPGGGFRGGEGDLIPFVEKNVLGSSPSACKCPAGRSRLCSSTGERPAAS